MNVNFFWSFSFLTLSLRWLLILEWRWTLDVIKLIRYNGAHYRPSVRLSNSRATIFLECNCVLGLWSLKHLSVTWVSTGMHLCTGKHRLTHRREWSELHCQIGSNPGGWAPSFSGGSVTEVIAVQEIIEARVFNKKRKPSLFYYSKWASLYPGFIYLVFRNEPR